MDGDVLAQLTLDFVSQDHRNLDEIVDLNDFLSTIPLTSHLKDWDLDSYQGGSIKIEVERKHEWELVLAFLLIKAGAAAGIVAAGFLAEMGKQLAQKLSERLFKDSKTQAKIKANGDVLHRSIVVNADSSVAQLLEALPILLNAPGTGSPNVRIEITLSQVTE